MEPKAPISELAKLRLKQTEYNALENKTEYQEKLTSALNDFFEAYDNMYGFDREAITEIVNTNRHAGINIASKKDVTDKTYALSDKNILKYGPRDFATLTEYKNSVCEINYIYENSVNNQQVLS